MKRRVSELYKKELRAYFDTPTAYVVTVVMLLLLGYLFASPLFLMNQASLASLLDSAPLLFLFFIPALTMRLYAEEYKSGTIEILATLPVLDVEILASKYLAAMTVVTFMLAGTAPYPIVLWLLGNPDWGAMLCGYAALWLSAALLASIGLWASTLTRNQITAFITAFLIGFILFLAGKFHVLFPPLAATAMDFIGFDSHMATLGRGVLDTRDLLYFATFTGYFLYLAYLRSSLRRVL